jgi:glucose-6-phosphate 1-dehydrogenase
MQLMCARQPAIVKDHCQEPTKTLTPASLIARLNAMRNPLMQGLGIGREPEPLTIVIFGATGDLTRRKLIPALFSLYTRQHLSSFRVIGFARRPWSTQEFRDAMAPAVSRDNMGADFLSRLEYIHAPFDNLAAYRRLTDVTPRNMIFYLSTPPDAYATIVENIGAAGLAAEDGAYRRIIVEKPVGKDLASALELNRRLRLVFDERQVYRIDHYLGKETVQNLMVLRFGNSILEPLWNSRYIEQVQITVAEELGVETRGSYYDASGALRDMVQNHMLQLLCLVAMEPPSDLDSDTVRDEKQKVMRTLKPVTAETVAADTVRGQYAAGVLAGEAVPGYRSELNVDLQTNTETYVALRLHLDSWRWSGVPFLLRTGKRLARKVSEIAVFFRDPPHVLFADQPRPRPNSLVIRVQPDEGATFNLNSKVPGFATDMNPVHLSFSYGGSFGEEPPEAYERLLLDCMVGDATLFIRADQVESSWRFVGGILDLWRDRGQRLVTYRAGSQGPDDAVLLTEGLRSQWRKL